VDQAQSVGVDVGGNRVTYDVTERKLNGAPMQSRDGKVSLQVFVDRPMIEICGNHGEVYITSARETRAKVSAVEVFTRGGGPDS